jgi:hypothetical protein
VAIVLLAFDWQFWRRRTPSSSGAVYRQPVVSSDDLPRARAGDRT